MTGWLLNSTCGSAAHSALCTAQFPVGWDENWEKKYNFWVVTKQFTKRDKRSNSYHYISVDMESYVATDAQALAQHHQTDAQLGPGQ